VLISIVHSQNSDIAIAGYQLHHNQFINKRDDKLKRQQAKRKAHIIECGESIDELAFDDEETGYFEK